MPVNLDTLRQQPLTLIAPATQTLADGGSIGAWRKAMEVAIRRSQTAAYIAATAERLHTTPALVKGLSRAERKELDARIDAQLKYLDGFVRDLKAGKLTMAQAQARANLYAGAVRGGYYAARYPGLSNVPGDGSTPCLGNCKCTLEQKGDLIYWRLNPAEHCDGCVSRAAASPYQLTTTTKAQTDQEKAMFAAMGGGGGGGSGGGGGGKNTLWPKNAEGKRVNPNAGGSGGAGDAAPAAKPENGSTSPDAHSAAANDAHARMLDAEAESERRSAPLRAARAKIMEEKGALYEQRGALEAHRAGMANATPAEKAAITRKINEIDKKLHAESQKSEAMLQEILSNDQKVAHDILKVSRPADVSLRFADIPQAEQQRVHDAINQARQLTSTKGLDGHPVRIEMRDGVRAHAEDYGAGMTLSGSIVLAPTDGHGVIAHELGHHIEYRNPEVKTRAAAFLGRRTRGEQPQTLNSLTGNQHYRDDETARPDQFINPYMGKVYGQGHTEIVSMGIELMITDPVGFAKKDPDYFKFMYDVLRAEEP